MGRGDRRETSATIAVEIMATISRVANVESERRSVVRIDDDAVVGRQRSEHAHTCLNRHRGAIEGTRLDARRRLCESRQAAGGDAKTRQDAQRQGTHVRYSILE